MFPTLAVIVALLLPLAKPAVADDFYKDKTITLIVGTTAGGGYDTDGRLIAQYLSRYIPGSPNVIVSNMPGASGVRAVNYLYSIAPKDGTVIGTFNSAMPFLEAAGAPGVQYKSSELSWIGNLSQSVQAVVVWHTAGVRTLEDAKKKEVIMGALGSGGTMTIFPRLLNGAFGTKFRIVSGYQGGTDVNIAMERGEVEGRGAGAWTTWKHTRPDWIKEEARSCLWSRSDRRKIRTSRTFRCSTSLLKMRSKSRCSVSSPETSRSSGRSQRLQNPADRLQILRRAFELVTKDPGFPRRGRTIGSDVDPQSGEEVTKDVASIVDVPPAVVEKVKVIVGFK